MGFICTNILFGARKTHVEFYSDSNYFRIMIYNATYGAEELIEKDSTVKLSQTEMNIVELIKKDLTLRLEKSQFL